jgi:hypothetical protein
MDDPDNLPALLYPKDKGGSLKEVYTDEYPSNAEGQLRATTEAIEQDRGSNEPDDVVIPDSEVKTLNKTKKRRRPKKKNNKKKNKTNVPRDGSDTDSNVEEEDEGGLMGLGISHPLLISKFNYAFPIRVSGIATASAPKRLLASRVSHFTSKKS